MIAAVVLAAGLSIRMGSPKLVLPWGETTVIGQVVGVLERAGIPHIVVVTGGFRQQVEAALQGSSARTVYNPCYQEDEMLLSLRKGLSALSEEVSAALVVLGDQPQIEEQVVQAVADHFEKTKAPLVIPSYRMRRGHPWLVARSLWPAILQLSPAQTMRQLIEAHAECIAYLQVDSPSVLRDLDTPEDYYRERPPSFHSLEAAPMSTDQKTILVVEDEPDTAEMFSEMMRLSGYRVIKSLGGEAVKDLLHREKPDAVVLDIMLPDFSGLEVLRYIRQEAAFTHTPVVVVSAKGLPVDIRDGLEAGASTYLTKPVAYADLKNAVEQLLR